MLLTVCMWFTILAAKEVVNLTIHIRDLRTRGCVCVPRNIYQMYSRLDLNEWLNIAKEDSSVP